MSPHARTPRLPLAIVALMVLVIVGCGQGSDEAVVAETPTGAEDDVRAYCAAVEALDQTDGTTRAAVALDAFDDLKRTAPAEIRDDVVLVSDYIIVNDYPTGADASMEAASPEDRLAASARLAAYNDEHCDASSE